MGIETRMILISPDSEVTAGQMVSKIQSIISTDPEMAEAEITVNETCFGALIEGDAEKVKEIVEKVRMMDPNGIFSKLRGFPIGDKRICRATRKGGPRPGFHQLELESQLLPKVRIALDKCKSVSLNKLNNKGEL